MLSSSSSWWLHIPGNGRTPPPGLVLGVRLLGQVGPLLGLRQVHLGLAELAEVDRGDLLSLLDLLLVSLDLLLQLLHQVRHPLRVLPVLCLLERELLDPSLSLPEVLVSVSHPPLLGVELGLELPAPGVHLLHHLPPPLDRVRLSVIKLHLQVLRLGLLLPPVPLQSLSLLLLRSQLLREAGGVHHELLGALVGHGRLALRLIRFTSQVGQVGLQLPLGADEALVLDGEVGEVLVGVGQVLLSLAPRPA